MRNSVSIPALSDCATNSTRSASARGGLIKAALIDNSFKHSPLLKRSFSQDYRP